MSVSYISGIASRYFTTTRNRDRNAKRKGWEGQDEKKRKKPEGGKESNEAPSLPSPSGLEIAVAAAAAAAAAAGSSLSLSRFGGALSRSRFGFRRAGGIVIIIKGTLIKTRTTRRALRSASGAAPGTRRPRPRRHRRRRHPGRRRFRRRRRSDYLALHLGTSERARRRCQLRFKSHNA